MIPIFNNLSTYITKKVIIILSGVILFLSLYIYISYLRNSIQILNQENILFKNAIQEQQNTIASLQIDFNNIIKSKEEVNEKIIELQNENNKLKEILFREEKGKTSLEKLILKDKKNRIQTLINNATKRVFRCFEIISGSMLKKDEKNDC